MKTNIPMDDERISKVFKVIIAGIMRNAVMADNTDALIAYWDGISRGTKNMIDEARKKGLAVRIKRY